MFTDEKLPRREFLRISSVVVASAAASGLFHAESLFAASSSEGGLDPLLSVGYVADAPEPGASVRLGYASEILMGDPAFLSRSALVTITSYSRGPKYRRQPNGSEIDAIFPANAYVPEKYPRFRAWLALGKEGEDVAAASGSRFRLPVTSTGGAQFVVRRLRNDGPPAEKAAAAPAPEETLLRLSTGVESNTIKLKRGIYVIAFRESGRDEMPNWAGYKLTRNPIGELSIPYAPFSYVLMSIDYAME